jgi:hypothetical protein
MNRLLFTISSLFLFSAICIAQSLQEEIVYPQGEDTFLVISPHEYPIKEAELPVFCTSVKIGTLPPTSAITQIFLEYPEYQELSRNEIRHIQQFDTILHSTVQIKHSLQFSRKTGYVDLQIFPIVKDKGIYKRLISCKVKIRINKNQTQPASRTQLLESSNSRWSTTSVLAQGKWAKIRVKNEGIYSLTPSFLAKMGFMNPEKVKLFGYGGRIIEEKWSFDDKNAVPNDLQEVPLYRKPDGTSIFYAEGTIRWTYDSGRKKWLHENNPYSQYSYYFITEGDNPAPWITVTAQSLPIKTVGNITHYALFEKDAFGWYEGGREMYDDYDFEYNPARTINIPAISHDAESPKANIDVSISASSPSSTTKVSISHNGESLGSLTIPKYSQYQSAYEVRRYFTSNYTDKENTIKISISPSNPARLNYVRLNYTRKLEAQDDPFSFSPCLNYPICIEINSADDNTHLWRIADGISTTCEIASTLNEGKLRANVDNGNDRFIIVNTKQNYPTPEWDKEIECQNLHGDLTPYDMVIIVPESKKLLEEAERLADAHRTYQQLKVKVVDAGQLYNEFSSGTPDASAYRRYLKMLYDRASNETEMPKYLLLFGDCAWDNRMITSEWNGHSPQDYLLSFEVTDGFVNPGNTSFPLGEQNSYVTDDFFGWLDDNEGNDYTQNKIDLGIGRFPCHDASTAKILVDKCIAYMTNTKTGAWKNTIYMIADNGNANLHMNDAEAVVQQVLASTADRFIIKKVYNDAYPRVSSGTGHTFPTVTKILQEAMYGGAAVFNYTGHGNPSQLSNNRILKTEDFNVPSLGNLPLWIMASCEISPYDSQKEDIGRTAVRNPNGGAISVLCASRSVYSNYNRGLNIAFNKYVFGIDENGKRYTMGDALRLAKAELVTPTSTGSGIKDYSINKLKYILLGDPALTLAVPTGKVVVDSINGIPLRATDKIQLKAGMNVRFSGHVSNISDEILTDYNGSITATVNDRMETIICKNNDGSAESPMVYEDRTKKIFEGSDSIKSGRFTIRFQVPKDISYTNDCGRVTFYAVNNTKTLECHGNNEQFYLNGTDASLSPDTVPPSVYIYLDEPEFPNGGITGHTPTFYADIKDDSGINTTGIGIGHDMELVIDEQTYSPIKLNNYFTYKFGSYQEGTISYPLAYLEAGKHHLSFRVWDVNGNSNTQQLDFYVKEGNNSPNAVYATENPAKYNTSFVTSFSSDQDETGSVTIEVFNLNGQKIWNSQPNTLTPGVAQPVTYWNLKDNNGNKVPAGIYLYKAIYNGSKHQRETNAKKIVILGQ